MPCRSGVCGFVLILPALGISLVKPCVVGTTARASKENVRSIGYSIYYTMVNIGGAPGPISLRGRIVISACENVYRVAAIGVFAMFFVVLLSFASRARRATRPTFDSDGCEEFLYRAWQLPPCLAGLAGPLVLRIAGWVKPAWTVPWWTWIAFLAVVLAGISRFMWFLVIFTGYWIVFWQQYISLPGFIHGYIDSKADVEKILVVDGLTVIWLTLAVNYLTRKIPAFAAVILGTVITSLSWLILALRPTIWGAIFSYSSSRWVRSSRRRATTNTFRGLRLRGSRGRIWGSRSYRSELVRSSADLRRILLHHYGEVQHQPAMIWFLITGVGWRRPLGWVYDKFVRTTGTAPA